ncbi:MAG: hypothetical protein K0S27_169 [Gammaproteobacteria bacterium]|jgi:hypothetical protein|nr:hypothetical protein [Gammaproteobacteria bacterium]
MSKWLGIIWGFLFLGASEITYAEVSASITFNNETTQAVQQTREPYTDHFSHYHPDYAFNKPLATLLPQQSSTATISYPWSYDWYGMSQYTYNYVGRSSKYGCFITELRLSGKFFDISNFNLVIASYKKDPEHLDDYLMCSVDRNSNTAFTVHLKSMHGNIDDTQNYSIAGDSTLLDKLADYHIDLPIPLWVDQEQKQAFVIQPRTSQPALVASDSLVFTPPPNDIETITVANHTDEILVAGSPLLDRYSQLSKAYYVSQPDTINPGEKKEIKISKNGDFMARFNYHILGSKITDNGCYITVPPAAAFITPQFNYSPFIAAFHLPELSSFEKNVFCAVSSSAERTVAIYDNVEKGFNDLKICEANENCISYFPRERMEHDLHLDPNNNLNHYSYMNTTSLPYFNFPLDAVHAFTLKNMPLLDRGGSP